MPTAHRAIDAMGELATQSRQPLLLGDLNGVPLAEIARKLQIPLRMRRPQAVDWCSQ